MASNTVNQTNSFNTIVITDQEANQITVTQPVTSILEVGAVGPQGPKGDPGDPGPSGSLQPSNSGSFEITGSLLVSGSATLDTVSATGSFTGSFIGDGSQLTGIVSSKWTGSNPISRESDVEITGSLDVTGGITGSLLGTGSYALQALTASYAVSASHEIIKEVSSSFADTASYVNPLVQDVEITGSFNLQTPSSPSTRERLLTADVSDAPGDFFFINNGTIGNGNFFPVFGGIVDSSTASWALGFNGLTTAANDVDTSNYGLIDFVALKTTNAIDPLNGTLSNVSNRKLFSFRGLTNNNYLTILANGNVLIGTTTDGARLKVKGTGTTSSTTALRVENSNGDASFTVRDDGLTIAEDDLYISRPGISYGISINHYQINGGSAGVTLRRGNSTVGLDGSSYITLKGHAGYYQTYQVNQFGSAADSIAFRWQTSQDPTNWNTLVTRMQMLANGNLGIGTTTPSSKLDVSGSVKIQSSGSTVLDIQGSQGQLFSVVDELSGSLMSVNDVSGLPILEVFSDDRVEMGTYGSPGLIVTGSTIIATGSLFGTASYAILPEGNLQVSGGVALDGTLRPLEDQQGNVSPLRMSTQYVTGYQGDITNVVFGPNAGNISSGTNNTAIGYNARQDLGNRSNTVVIGANAKGNSPSLVVIGVSATGRSQSTVIGYSAGSNTNYITAVGSGADASEYGASLGIGADASGQYSVALGRNALSSGTNSISLGAYSDATQIGSIALGSGSLSENTGSIAIGVNVSASGEDSVALGTLTQATAVDTVALGNGANASGERSITIGLNAATGNRDSTVIGGDSTGGRQSVAIGKNANSSGGENNTAVGPLSRAGGGSSTGIGRQANASGTNAVALGPIALSSGNSSISIGNQSDANQDNAIAIGRESEATAAGAIALGANITADQADTLFTKNAHFSGSVDISGSLTVHTEGNSTQTTSVIYAGTGSLALVPSGSGAIVASVPDGTAVGGNARGAYAVDLQRVRDNQIRIASGSYSSVLGGSGNQALGDYSVVLGGQSNRSDEDYTITGGQGNETSGGTAAIALGYQNDAIEDFSVALGYRNTASGTSSVALGYTNTASSNYSTVSGGQNNTASTNTHATVVGGRSNTSSGTYSTSGGFNNTASGLSSTSFGSTNISSGNYAVTMGNSNEANNTSAIALGQDNTASGTRSVALGLSNTASGQSAVALGQNNSAAATYSSVLSGGSNTVGTVNDAIGSVIAGGLSNDIQRPYAAIGGGRDNTVQNVGGQGDYGTVSGGQNNTAGGASHTTVVGGSGNTSSGQYAIAGGNSNTASGQGSIALGQNNQATGTNSIALGANLTASLDNTLYSNNLIASGSLTVTGSTTIDGETSIYKSGSTVLTVEGSQGELFSITDSLSGSLFSVSNISGLPILEVFSDNTILLGSYLAPTLFTTKTLTVDSGSTTIYNVPTSSYDGAFFEYTIKSGSNARAGTVTAIWQDTSVSYMDNSTADIGTTSGFEFGVILSGSNMVLTGSASTDEWTVKTVIRSI